MKKKATKKKLYNSSTNSDTNSDTSISQGINYVKMSERQSLELFMVHLVHGQQAGLIDDQHRRCVCDSNGCRQLGTQLLFQLSWESFAWEFRHLPQLHIPTNPNLHPELYGRSNHCSNLWRHLQLVTRLEPGHLQWHHVFVLELYLEL